MTGTGARTKTIANCSWNGKIQVSIEVVIVHLYKISHIVFSPPPTPLSERSPAPSPASTPEPFDDPNDGDYQHHRWDYSPNWSPESSDFEAEEEDRSGNSNDSCEEVDDTSQVLPAQSEEEIAKTTLRRWSMYLHPVYRCLICVECRCILAETARGHRKTKHGLPFPASGLLEHSLTVLGVDKTSDWSFPDHPIVALEGVQVQKSFMCPVPKCGKGYAEKKKAGVERRDFLRVMGAGAAAAVPLLAAGRAQAVEMADQRVKQRYRETDHVKKYYETNRF